ncbi:DUF3782 domain-containing protein [Geminocystis sp. GBBB08]|uniref:PD-(D/E)XK nuclease family protein n=1 Tax=Geminocystis sp. GBBB08 TaxID=2604140 RepID=UPI0027E24A16|nr:DUF3782 domain-containing protein [Geminocystis sp. GBBB08]MBL1210468.1 DUF3782 domain-containing protein [Geminocystis sp. GBBB08]
MTEIEIKNIIQQQLPELIAKDPTIRDFILRTVSEYYSPKEETDRKFDLILAELRHDREEQTRKWEEQTRKWEEQSNQWEENNRRWEEQSNQWEENNRRWEENNRRWEENSQRLDKMQHQIDETLTQIKKLDRKYDSTIGALGSRWGLYSEASFRNGLKAILEESFGVQVLNVNDFDDQGEVFGRPDQVEIDVIIKNGLLILCEIKSNMDKAGMYIFDRKVSFYEKRHHRKATRKMVICPMVDDRALPVAKNLGIELYSYADSVELN